MRYAIFASLGFGILYTETTFVRAGTILPAAIMGGLAGIVFLTAFLLPSRIFHYSNDDVAPRVQTQVLNRALLGAAMILALNIVVWFVLGASVSLLEELFGYSLVTMLLFFGFAGAVASHVVYLQKTKQYNSNQLVAVIGLVTLVLFVLILFLLVLDWTILRAEYIHVRDLTLITLVFLGYGRAVYLMAHH
jgi:hypothetical protein